MGSTTLSAFGLFFAFVTGCSSTPSQGQSGVGAPDSSTDSARPTDAGADVPLGEGGPSLCNGGDFVFCDGFEDTTLSDNWTQTSNANAPAPQADSVHYYRGTHALHARTDKVDHAGSSAYSTVQKLAPGGWPSHFFTRVFVYQPSPRPPSPEGLLDLVDTSDPYPGVELLSNPPTASHGALATFTYNTSMDQSWTANTGLPLDQWVCFEVEIDTFAGVSHVYMNDAEVTALGGSRLSLTSVGNLSVGMSFFSPSAGQGQQDAWFDEVAVSTSRIGCKK